jgi:hypothetical protein
MYRDFSSVRLMYYDANEKDYTYREKKTIFRTNKKLLMKKNDVRVCLVSQYVTCIFFLFDKEEL